MENYQLIFYMLLVLFIIKTLGIFEFQIYHYIGILILTIFLIIWALFIHIQFYIDGKNKVITINDQKINVYSSLTNSTTDYYFKDISKLLYVRAASIDPPFVFTHSIVENFHFLRIYFIDGTYINITSLMKSDLTEVVSIFSDFEIIRVKKGYCSLNGNYKKYLNTQA